MLKRDEKLRLPPGLSHELFNAQHSVFAYALATNLGYVLVRSLLPAVPRGLKKQSSRRRRLRHAPSLSPFTSPSVGNRPGRSVFRWDSALIKPGHGLPIAALVVKLWIRGPKRWAQ